MGNNAVVELEKMEVTERKTCRVCHSDRLTPIFSLGMQYVNNFIKKGDEGRYVKAPLELVLCENCSLLQLKHTAPQELLYSRFYWYRSGVTDTMKKALRDITEKAEKMFSLKEGDVVLDIGSNDGTLLRTYTVPGLVLAGVEPADNLAEEGKKGLNYFIHDFWSYKAYDEIVGKKAKLITAIGMFYDMEDPNQFIADVAKSMDGNGVFITQLMCLKNMLDTNDVGNICHEHLEFYSFASLEYLFDKNGLEIFDVEINDINGGSYRVYACLKGSKAKAAEGAAERVRKVREDEKNLQGKGIYLDFYRRLEENKRKCVDFIKAEVAKGKRVWVYGASTKGNTILQYYGLDHTLIEAASERSREKWGKYTIGTMIPIVSEEEARKAQPDYFLVLPYAFFSEFYERENEWLEKGGKFIVPLPNFRVVGKNSGGETGLLSVKANGHKSSRGRNNLIGKIKEAHSLTRLFTARLPYVDFFVTGRCNLRCKHCFYIENIENASKSRELTFDEIKKISGNLGKIYYLTLTGGEATLREDLTDIIKVFYKQNDVKILALHTNGFFSDRVYNMTKEVLKACPDMTLCVSLSIDGFEHTHEKIRGLKGSFNKLLKTIEMLKEFKGMDNFDINMNTTLMNWNRDEIFELHEFVTNKLDIPHDVGYLRGEPKKTLGSDENLEVYKKMSKFIEMYQANRDHPYPFSAIKDALVQVGKDIVVKKEETKEHVILCQAGKKSIVISEEGDVFPCERLNKKLGNLRDYDYDINKILDKEETKNLTKWIKDSKCSCTWECIIPLNTIHSLKGNMMLMNKVASNYGSSIKNKILNNS